MAATCVISFKDIDADERVRARLDVPCAVTLAVVRIEMREIALGCGRAFGVGLYGVDLITSGGKAYVVDINTFPGFKGAPNAAELLAEYIMGEEAK